MHLVLNSFHEGGHSSLLDFTRVDYGDLDTENWSDQDIEVPSTPISLNISKNDECERSPSNSKERGEKVGAASKAGLSAAATKATDYEDREIQSLSANIINHQVTLLLISFVLELLKLVPFTISSSLAINEI